MSETGAIYQDATGRWAVDESLEQMALPDSVREVIGGRVGATRRRRRAGAVDGGGHRSGLRPRSPGAGHEYSEDELLDILDAAAAVALVRELADAPGRYSFAHALIQHTSVRGPGSHPSGPGAPAGGRGAGGPLRGPSGARVGELARHWFSATQPIDLTKAIDYSRQAGDAALERAGPCRRPALLRPGPRPLRPGRPTPIRCWASTWPSGSAPPSARRAIPAFRETLLDAARRAAELGDTERLVAAALANDRGILSTAGAIDADKVEILEMALGPPSCRPPRPGARPRHPVLGTRPRQPTRPPPGSGRRGRRHRRILW